MITLADYYMGRDVSHASDLTDKIRENAENTVRCVNVGMAMFYADCPNVSPRPVNSGWRPPSINATTPGAAIHSAHMTAEAIDQGDTDGFDLYRWSLRNQARLMKVGIVGMERAESTRIVRSDGVVERWCHWQTRPVGSGVFVFWPTTAAYEAWKATGDPVIVG